VELHIYWTSKHLWRDEDNLIFNPYDYDREDRLVAYHTVKSGRKMLAFRRMQMGRESISEITRPYTPDDDICMYTCHSAYLSCPVSLRVKLQGPRLLSAGGRMTRRVKAGVWGRSCNPRPRQIRVSDN